MTPSAKHAALIEMLDHSRRLVLRRLLVHDPKALDLAAQWQTMIRSRGHRQLVDRSINRAVALRRITDQRATFVQFADWVEDHFIATGAPRPVGAVASLDLADDEAMGTVAADAQVWPLRLVNWSGRWLIDYDDSAPAASLTGYLAATHGWSAD